MDPRRTTSRRSSDDFNGRTALLSPFDNLLCDRARTERCSASRHRLEIYTPKPKRRWGYFVLPVLDGDRLVARIDLAMDRKRDTLVAHAVHAEPKVPRGKRLPKAIRRELERLAAWRGAKRPRGPDRARRLAPGAGRVAHRAGPLPTICPFGHTAQRWGKSPYLRPTTLA